MAANRLHTLTYFRCKLIDMPVFIHHACLIAEKRVIELKYAGGLVAFRKDFQMEDDESYHQEDRLIVAIAAMDPEDFDLLQLKDKGLHFNPELGMSDDFTIVSRYGESPWTLPWLHKNTTFAWHADTDHLAVAQAQRIDGMFMSEIKAMFEAGKNPYNTIW